MKLILLTIMASAMAVTFLVSCGTQEKHKIEQCTPVGFDAPKPSCRMKQEVVNGIYVVSCCELVEEQ